MKTGLRANTALVEGGKRKAGKTGRGGWAVADRSENSGERGTGGWQGKGTGYSGKGGGCTSIERRAAEAKIRHRRHRQRPRKGLAWA